MVGVRLGKFCQVTNVCGLSVQLITRWGCKSFCDVVSSMEPDFGVANEMNLGQFVNGFLRNSILLKCFSHQSLGCVLITMLYLIKFQSFI